MTEHNTRNMPNNKTTLCLVVVPIQPEPDQAFGSIYQFIIHREQKKKKVLNCNTSVKSVKGKFCQLCRSNGLAQWVNPQVYSSRTPYDRLVHVLAVPIPIQLPVKCLGKAKDDPCALVPNMGDLEAASGSCLHSGHFSHLRSEPVLNDVSLNSFK